MGRWRIPVALILLTLAAACGNLDRVNEAARLQDRGDFAGAAALCEEVIAGSPSQEDAAYCRLFAGFSYFSLDQFDKALPHLRALTAFADLDPAFRRSYVMVAATLLELGRYEEAVHYASRSLALAPGDPSAYGYRAAAYLGLGLYDVALEDLLRLTRARRPPQAAAKDQVGLAVVHAILGHRAEAFAALERIRPLAPDYDASDDQALVHLLLGDVEKARASARRLDLDRLRDHPLLAAYWARRAAQEEAENRRQRGDVRGALQRLLDYSREWTPDSEIVKRVAALVAGLHPRPAIPAEAVRLAKEAERLQQAATDERGLDAAIEAYHRAVQAAPWWPDPHLNLALLHEQRRDWVLAAAQLGAFLAAAPDAPEADAARRKMFEMRYRAEHGP